MRLTWPLVRRVFCFGSITYRGIIECDPGRILWDELALHYQCGVDWTRATRKAWDSLAGAIDPERHAAVAKKLSIQERDAGSAEAGLDTYNPE